jgi:hypothetical protein
MPLAGYLAAQCAHGHELTEWSTQIVLGRRRVCRYCKECHEISRRKQISLKPRPEPAPVESRIDYLIRMGLLDRAQLPKNGADQCPTC